MNVLINRTTQVTCSFLICQNIHIKYSHAEINIKYALVCDSNTMSRPLALTDINLLNNKIHASMTRPYNNNIKTIYDILEAPPYNKYVKSTYFKLCLHILSDLHCFVLILTKANNYNVLLQYAG